MQIESDCVGSLSHTVQCSLVLKLKQSARSWVFFFLAGDLFAKQKSSRLNVRRSSRDYFRETFVSAQFPFKLERSTLEGRPNDR